MPGLTNLLGVDLVTDVLVLLVLDTGVLGVDLVTDVLVLLGLVTGVLMLDSAISEREPVMTKLLHALRNADNFLFSQSPEELPTHAGQLPGV